MIIISTIKKMFTVRSLSISAVIMCGLVVGTVVVPQISRGAAPQMPPRSQPLATHLHLVQQGNSAFGFSQKSVLQGGGMVDTTMNTLRPEVTMSRWNGQDALTLSYGAVQAHGVIDSQSSMMTWGVGTQSVRAYPIATSSANEDGGVEMEVVLNAPPKTNTFDYTISSPSDLQFYYQPPLNEENHSGESCTANECVSIKTGEITRTRDANVVGSYAVYSKTKKNHIEGQTNYATGKFFQIYRPKVTDASGSSTWGTLHIAGGSMQITVPQSFLNAATYPVVVDPTMGYTTAGGTNQSLKDVMGAQYATTTEGGYARSVSFYLYNISILGKNATAGLYTANSTTDMGTLIATTTAAAYGTCTAPCGWQTLDFPLNSQPWVASSTAYFPVIEGSSNTGAFYGRYDTGTVTYAIGSTTSIYPWFPSPMTAELTGAQLNSIYATYAPYPSYTEKDWRWFQNADSVQPGSPLAALKATTTNVADGDILRLRMSVNVATTTVATGTAQYRLQYATGPSCSTAKTWSDVIATSTGQTWEPWVQYDNPSVADGAQLTTSLLSSSTVLETYGETNTSATNTNAINVGQDGEWDWTLKDNGAQASTTYCFRMTSSSTAAFDAYNSDSYAKLITGGPATNEVGYRWRKDDGNQGNVTGFGSGGSFSGSVDPYNDAYHKVIDDGSYLYYIGHAASSSSDTSFLVQKRDRNTGALVTSFGNNGTITENATSSFEYYYDGVSVGNYLYLTGSQNATSSDSGWVIEKRDKTTGALVSGFGVGGKIDDNPTTNNDLNPNVITDGSYLYVFGDKSTGSVYNQDARIEKRDLTTGALVTSFGTGGYVDVAISSLNDFFESAVIRGGFIYLAGHETLGGDRSWWVEKRSTKDGSLDTGFGAGGDLIENVAAGQLEDINRIAIDGSYMYLAGWADDSSTPYVNETLHLEKRTLSTGALCDGTGNCDEGQFGTGGVVSDNLTNNDDEYVDLALHGDSILLFGKVNATSTQKEFMLEKRNRVTGALCSSTSTCNGGEFLTGGRATSSLTSYANQYNYGSFNGTYFYTSGYHNTSTSSSVYQYYTEKRYVNNGALVGTTTGEASWYAAENTAPTVERSTPLRLRFSIDNTGNYSHNSRYQLEVAAKGGAGSCEAVSSAAYSAVPVAGSCGSSVACMASTQLTNNQETTPQLTSHGTYYAGTAVENTSNTAATTTIYKGQYTELEYGFEFTSNAVAGTPYCLRLTNNGTALASYTKVADVTTAATTTLSSATSSDPLSVSIAPGGSATTSDAFALVTDGGTDSVTTLTIALENASSTSLLEVTDSTGSTVYGSTSNPTGTSTTITLTTPLSITTSTTTYKLRITPKGQAALPSGIHGSLIAVSTDVLSFTATNPTAGTDTAFPVTIDNQSLPAFGITTASSSFATSTDYGSTLNPEAPKTADFNHDGYLDFVTVGSTQSQADVFLNNGDGTFASGVTYSASGPLHSVAVGDFNGDGYADIVAANNGASAATVFLNNGDGTFAAASDYSTNAAPEGIAADDFNGDGYPDIVTSNYSSSTMSVLLNDGNGTFGTATLYTTGTGPYHVVTADVNGDGFPDIITNDLGTSTVSVFINKGDGTFQSKVDYTAIATNQGIAAGDFNGDGYPDIVTGDGNTSTNVVLLNNGNGTFASPVSYSTGGYNITDFDTADFNNDGHLDFVSGEYSTNVTVFRNQGDGTFVKNGDYSENHGVSGVAAADLNNDGLPDILASNYSAGNLIRLTHNTSTSTLTATAGAGQATISYTTPPQSDYAGVVVLRSTSAITDAPVDGTTYTAGNTIGAATVACVDTATATGTPSSCTATGLTAGTPYYFKAFVEDADGNYSYGLSPSGSPVTPTAASNGPGLTLSGTLYASDGATPLSGKTITAAVSTSTTSLYSATTDASGNYSIAGVATSTIHGFATTSPAEANNWNSVAYGNGRFVAVSNSGTHRVMYSDDGATWYTATSAAQDAWEVVRYGAGKFVAFACGINSTSCNSTAGQHIMYSSDGINWTLTGSTTDTTRWDSGIPGASLTYGGGQFVVYFEGIKLTSPDGITWTESGTGNGIGNSSVAYGNGTYVVGENAPSTASSRLHYSTDGTNWYNAAGLPTANWSDVAYGDGRFVMSGADTASGHTIITSTTGTSWSYVTNIPYNLTWDNIKFANGYFFAISNTATTSPRAMYSTDGSNWSTLSLNASTSAQWNDIAYGKGKFVVVGNNTPDGLFSINAGTGENTPITVYVNPSTSTTGATTLTYAPNNQSTSTLSGIDLTAGTLTLNHATNSASVDLGNADFYDSTSDSDILFTATTSTTTVGSAASTTKLVITSGTTVYAPQNLILNGSYTNSGTFSNQYGNVYASSTSAETFSGSLTGSSAFNSLTVRGAHTLTLSNNASTTNLTVDSGATLVAPSSLTLLGNYTNNGTFTNNSGTLYATGTTNLSGTLSGSSALNNLTITGTSTLFGNASTSNLTISSGSLFGAFINVAAPITISGNFTNNGTYFNPDSTYLTGTGKTVGGTGALGNLTISGSYTTSGTDATTSALTIATGGSYTAPSGVLAVTDDFTNNGTFSSNAGTLNFKGTSITASGTLTSASALHSVTLNAASAFGTGGAVTNGSGTSTAYGITADTNNIYVTGYCTGCGTQGGQAYYTFAYNKSTGATVWSTTTDPTTGNDAGSAITADASNVYVTGYCTGCGTGGVNAVYTMALDKSTGAKVWATTTDSTHNTQGEGITNDANNVYVGGWCNSCGTAGGYAIYTFALNKTTGAEVWATTTDPSTTFDEATAITNDANNVYTTGYCSGCGTAGGYAFYTIAISKATQSTVWATTTDANANTDQANAITADNNTVYVTGNCQSCGASGGVAFNTVAYNKTTGATDWSTITDPKGGNDTPYAITMDSNNVYVTGQTWNYGGSGRYDYYTTAYDKTTGAQQWYSVTNTNGTGNVPQAITSDQDSLYVTGNCLTCGTGSVPAYYTLALDKSDGALRDGTDTTTFATNASTSALTISAGSTLIAPVSLSVAGNYTNNGTFTANSGSVYFNGTAQQTATGTLSGTSAFNNLTLINTSQNGSSTQSVFFGAPLTTTGTMAMTANSSAAFLAAATNTLQNVDWNGSNGSPVWLRSTSAGTQWKLDIPGSQVAVNYVDVQDSDATLTSGGVIATNSTDSGDNTNWSGLATTGSTTLADASTGQVSNAFTASNGTSQTLFRFHLTPHTESGIVNSLSLTLSGLHKVTTGNLTSLHLYRDLNQSGSYDAGDTQVGGTGSLSVNGQQGSITFSTSFTATTSQDYIVTGNLVAMPSGAQMVMDLYPASVSVTGVTSIKTETVSGSVSHVNQLMTTYYGAGSSGGSIGGAAPAGNGTVSGGTSDGGTILGTDPNFYWPTADSGSWTNGSYAYDNVNGTYATDAVNNNTHSFTNENFSVPGSDTITGVAVELVAHDTTGAGSINVELSWDGGTTWTSVKSSGTLSTSDALYTIGSQSDTWGRTWSPSDFSNANFVVRLTGVVTSDTASVDSIKVAVYHQSSGGGGGGGGAI